MRIHWKLTRNSKLWQNFGQNSRNIGPKALLQCHLKWKFTLKAFLQIWHLNSLKIGTKFWQKLEESRTKCLVAESFKIEIDSRVSHLFESILPWTILGFWTLVVEPCQAASSFFLAWFFAENTQRGPFFTIGVKKVKTFSSKSWLKIKVCFDPRPFFSPVRKFVVRALTQPPIKYDDFTELTTQASKGSKMVIFGWILLKISGSLPFKENQRLTEFGWIWTEIVHLAKHLVICV